MTTRRNFLRTAGAFGLASILPSYCVRPVLGEEAVNDRLQTGHVGLGGMGSSDAREMSMLSDVRFVCDVDAGRLAAGLKSDVIGTLKGKELAAHPEGVSDYRRILDRSDLDVISIGTPDHWHTKIAVEAMQAGKHVFCQKPLTLTLEENALIRRACAKYGKVFQVGTQQRSQRNQFATAALLVRKGFLGEIQRVTCITDPGRKSPAIPKAQVPDGLDWNFWLGQAPVTDFLNADASVTFDPAEMQMPFCRHHSRFRWWFEYSGGKITDWGAHHVDSALWILDRQKPERMPTEYHLKNATFLVPYENGRTKVENVYNTPIDFEISCRFADGLEMVVISEAQDPNGILIEGTKGKIHVNRARIAGKVYEEGHHKSFTDEDFSTLAYGKPYPGWHKDSFFRCIREGGKPISDATDNTYSMQICHLCNLACRLNRDIHWDTKTEQIVGDDLAASFFGRPQRKGFELPEV